MDTLRGLIQRNGIKQKDMAAALGIAEETLSRWSQGHVSPSGENLVRLLTYLRQFEPGLQAEDLLAVEPPSAPTDEDEAVA